MLTVKGWYDNHSTDVRIAPEGTPALNYGFDITPAHLVTGLITEKGTCKANRQEISYVLS
ncbi:Methylthioribose-1-phosphate isomerase [subsurface metagenome]